MNTQRLLIVALALVVNVLVASAIVGSLAILVMDELTAIRTDWLQLVVMHRERAGTVGISLLTMGLCWLVSMGSLCWLWQRAR